MDEKILAAIAALGNQMNEQFARIDKRFDKLESRMDKLESRMDKLESRMDKLESRMDKLESRVTALEAGQKESHQMLRAVLSANEKNAAEIEGLKVSTASVTSLQDLRRDVADSFAYVAQKVKEG
ncbi:hypothetical protein [uncultured Selenomonas sp.]|uniref:hypothetical protein n=1 Tax=uncultured Selenomonas sp. TaxID=159275 RepID=UPI0025E71AEA|nr:hypothetical protein [uncultured Selenomonas sp.]